jgi:DNA ligase 1
VLLDRLVAASQKVASTRSRIAKRDAIAAALRAAGPDEARLVVSYLSGELPQGSIGVGPRSLRDLPPPATEARLTLLELDGALSRIAAAVGSGSRGVRASELERLFGRATSAEQTFLVALLVGELRQGALAGVMTEAVAAAADIPAAAVRRAAMVSGDLAAVASAALAGGPEALGAFSLRVLTPLQPMLAQSADDVEAALNRAGYAVVEWKLDGARVQVHLLDGEVRAFTRNLADVTDRLPEVVEVLRSGGIRSAIVDGEVIALHDDGHPRPFQVTMSRFGSSRGVDVLRSQVPLSLFLFDCLHLDGEDLIDRPTRERIAALESAFSPEVMVPRVWTSDPAAARRVFDDALRRGTRA